MLKENQAKNYQRQIRNKRYKTLIKNQFRKISDYFKEKKNHPTELKVLLSETQKVLDKAVNKKVIHENKAARKKSKLHKLINSKENFALPSE